METPEEEKEEISIKVDKTSSDFINLLKIIAEILARQKYDIHNEFRNLER